MSNVMHLGVSVSNNPSVNDPVWETEQAVNMKVLISFSQ